MDMFLRLCCMLQAACAEEVIYEGEYHTHEHICVARR